MRTETMMANSVDMGNDDVTTTKGNSNMRLMRDRTSLFGMKTLVSGIFLLALLCVATSVLAGPGPKHTYAALVDSPTELVPDGTPQIIGTSPGLAIANGGATVSVYTVTINLSSTIAAGEVTAVDVSDGTTTWASIVGSYGPGSVVTCNGSGIPVDTATLTIRVTLAGSSAGKTVGVELTTEDSGATLVGLPTATSLINIQAPPSDTLTVTTNTPVATTASAGQTDVQMQVIQVDSDNVDDNSVVITNVTVDDIGAAASGDIDYINVYMDDDANFGNGTLGKVATAFAGAQLNIDITSITATNRTVDFGTSKYIWITYDLNAGVAAGTALQSSVTDIAVVGPDSGDTGTWNSNNFTTTAAPADTLTVTSNTPGATAAAPGSTDVQMQVLQVDSDNVGDGSVIITNVTVDDIGTAASGDIDFINIYMDDDADFGNGTLGKVATAFAGAQLNVDITSIAVADRTVDFGSSKYIWITYDVNGGVTDGTQIQSSVTDIAVSGSDSGDSGTWNSNNISIASGPSATLADCSSCHNYFPAAMDSATRDAVAGTFVGDHDKHNAYTCATCHVTPATETATYFAHRTGALDIDNGNIGVGADNGTYSKGATFAQSNSPTGGTCSLVDCHNNADSPQWGVGTTSCSTCHALPPATNAHAAHYTAKGWAADETNCTVCHPDNTGGHSDVTDASVTVNAGLTPSGSSPAITCATTGVGCHNEKTTPAWNTSGITCTNCHTAGGAAAGDPTSGLHVTTNLTVHDETITGGAGTACEKCHAAVATTPHYNETVDTPSAWNTTNIPAGYDNATDGCAANCHSDGGTWNREWSGAADVTWDYANDAATADVCGNCHGSFFTGWNIVGDTSHDNPSSVNDANATTGDDPDTLATSKASHGECTKCHGWGHANYTGNTLHENDILEMNSTLDTSPGDGDCTTNCHSGQTLTMAAASGWTDGTVVGDGVACTDCHNGGVTTSAATGAHAAHGATTASVTGDPASVAVCIDCHGEDGTNMSGTHNDGNRDFTANLTYSAGRGVYTGSCSGTAACHSASSNILWNQTQAAVDNCAVCHENTADVDDIDGTNNSASMIDSTDYSATGHGKTGVVLACMDCHSTAVAHDFSNPVAGTNPFRLAGYGSDVNTFCSNEAAGCHETSTGMLNHNQTNAGANYTWGWTPNCTDCHDPHGDGTTFNNLKMVQQNPTDGSSGSHGVGGTTEGTAVDFTVQGGVAAGSYADGTAFKGICQVCHTQTTSFNDGTSEVAGSHPTSGLSPCVGCHTHDGGFKASGCSGCHGGGTTGATAANYWPDGVSGDNEAGAHVVHMTKLASAVYGLTLQGLLDDASSDTKQKALCEYCHDANAGDHTTALPGEVGPGKTPTGTADDFTYATSSCDTADCHNNNATPVWTGSSTGCTMCHDSSAGAGIVEPTSGLHAPGPTVSGQAHDQGLGTGCEGCHSLMTTNYPTFVNGSTHIDGTDDSATVAAASLDANLNYSGTTCFGSGNTGFTSCHSGVGDDGTWARLWDNTVSYDTGGTYVECAGCHGGFNNDWTYDGTQAGSTDHTKDWDTLQSSGDGPEVIGNHANTTNATKCNICHVYSDSPYDMTWGTGDHGDGAIQMNSTLGYSTSGFNCSSHCHLSNTDHSLEDSGWANGSISGPVLVCTDCHTGSGSGPFKVGLSSPHSTNDTTYTCQQCHFSNHDSRTTGTFGIVWSAQTMGEDYTADGKIYIAGASSEAESCWACHEAQTPDVSEWDGSSAIYDYGSVTTGDLNWFTTSWASANFSYKDGVLSTALGTNASTHGTNGGAAGVDQESAVGCTYCHDVHAVGNNGYTSGAAPYLRGSWKSSPYYEDGAPGKYDGSGGSGTSTYLQGATYGIVPRSSAATTNCMCGYWIDQNSGSPANGDYSTHAGLCTLCHGDGDTTPSEATDVTAVEGLWSGHVNTVAGGSHDGINNIFSNTTRIGDGVWNGLNGGPYMGNQSIATYRSSDYGGTIRTDDYGDGVPPVISGKSRPFLSFQWAGLTVDDNTVNATFHNFTCSKCHNPHASRLPKLMITNCLDVSHNTWDDTYTGSTMWDGNNFASMTYNTKEFAYASSAQNCHRYISGQEPDGWNSVTPW